MTQFLEGPTPPLIRRGGGGPAMQVHQKNLVCVCTTHQNTILLIDALNWEVTYKDLVSKVVLDPSNRECMIHCCTNCPGTKALCKFLEEELSDIDPDFQFHYSQWQTRQSFLGNCHISL